jgi:hypothetical protein
MFCLELVGLVRGKKAVRGRGSDGFDALIEHESYKELFEFRLYQSLRLSPNTWKLALINISKLSIQLNASNVVLVTNSEFNLDFMPMIPTNVEIWDYNIISSFASRYPGMFERWSEISREGFIYRSEPLPLSIAPLLSHQGPVRDNIGITRSALISDELEFKNHAYTSRLQEYGSGIDETLHVDSSLPLPGKVLCSKLKAVSRGQRHSKAFEEKCIDAIKYIFKDDLGNWSPQKKTYDGIHRYDIISRNISEHDFFVALLSDHRARYIIFEFKNYSKKITQKEIFSTEKYLYTQAMRSTAIIVSTLGVDVNARRVMHGAFRESGKLILSLTVDNICSMLHMRDQGEDPYVLLHEFLDDILMGIEK